jgi:hypothetical protein
MDDGGLDRISEHQGIRLEEIRRSGDQDLRRRARGPGHQETRSSGNQEYRTPNTE